MIIKDVILDISDSGRLAQLRLESGRIIAELIVHGLLKRVAENCIQSNDILAGRPNIFRGELYQLAGYEYLDKESESVLEKF